MKTIGPYGATCQVLLKCCVFLQGKLGFVCWQLLHDFHATENLFFNLAVNLLYFLSN